MTIIKTFTVNEPSASALWFQTLLAVDRGVPSRIITDGDALVVVADDNRAVRFKRAAR